MTPEQADRTLLFAAYLHETLRVITVINWLITAWYVLAVSLLIWVWWLWRQQR